MGNVTSCLIALIYTLLRDYRLAALVALLLMMMRHTSAAQLQRGIACTDNRISCTDFITETF